MLRKPDVVYAGANCTVATYRKRSRYLVLGTQRQTRRRRRGDQGAFAENQFKKGPTLERRSVGDDDEAPIGFTQVGFNTRLQMASWSSSQ